MSLVAAALGALRQVRGSRRGRVRVLGLGGDDAWDPVPQDRREEPAFLPAGRSAPPGPRGRVEVRRGGR